MKPVLETVLNRSAQTRRWRGFASMVLGPLLVCLATLRGAAAEAPLPAAALAARSSPAQLAWQAREVEMFVHFGPNTFTGQEWGNGRTPPAMFHPARLDARQWVAVARSFGAAGLVLTAKHHDGFCLWPTATTDYSVKASPWQEGRGDVVREFMDACREAGLAAGLYLSPADLHAPAYGRDHAAYNEYFLRQLRELLTHYGEVAEVWFGAWIWLFSSTHSPSARSGGARYRPTMASRFAANCGSQPGLPPAGPGAAEACFLVG